VFHFGWFLFTLLSFYLLVVRVEGYSCTLSHSKTHSHTWQDSSGQGIGPSQRLLIEQHSTLTREKDPCPRRYSNPQFQPAIGHRSTP